MLLQPQPFTLSPCLYSVKASALSSWIWWDQICEPCFAVQVQKPLCLSPMMWAQWAGWTEKSCKMPCVCNLPRSSRWTKNENKGDPPTFRFTHSNDLNSWSLGWQHFSNSDIGDDFMMMSVFPKTEWEEEISIWFNNAPNNRASSAAVGEIFSS